MLFPAFQAILPTVKPGQSHLQKGRGNVEQDTEQEQQAALAFWQLAPSSRLHKVF